MPRVSNETINKLNDFLDTFPAEALGKCALCNETLTHIVSSAEAQTGAPMATVTKELANRVNDGAAPNDKVTGESLRQKVIGKTTDKNLSVRKEQIKKPEEPEPGIGPDIEPKECPACKSHYPGDQDHCPNKCKESKPEPYVNTVTDAMQFARIAVSQLKRIRPNDPEKNKALDHVEQWIKTARS